ncbi:MAG: tetratricopeptide repeat protein [Bacteroidales bacterium]
MRLIFISIFFLSFQYISGQAGIGEYLSIAIEFTETGKYDAAIKLCDKLEKLDPENADIYYLRGINYYLLKNYEAAIDDFDSVLKLNPDHTDAYLYRAKAKKANNNLLGALSDYNKAKDGNFSQTVSSLAGDLIKSLISGK